LEESKEGAKSGAADHLVKEKKMGILDIGEDARCNENVVLERKKERDKLRDMEKVGQRGVKDEGTKKRDEE